MQKTPSSDITADAAVFSLHSPKEDWVVSMMHLHPSEERDCPLAGHMVTPGEVAVSNRGYLRYHDVDQLEAEDKHFIPLLKQEHHQDLP